jgi:hypothetical protein
MAGKQREGGQACAAVQRRQTKWHRGSQGTAINWTSTMGWLHNELNLGTFIQASAATHPADIPEAGGASS